MKELAAVILLDGNFFYFDKVSVSVSVNGSILQMATFDVLNRIINFLVLDRDGIEHVVVISKNTIHHVVHVRE